MGEMILFSTNDYCSILPGPPALGRHKYFNHFMNFRHFRHFMNFRHFRHFRHL